MVFGEVFEFGLWPNKVVTQDTVADIELDSNVLFNSFPSLHIAVTATTETGSAGLVGTVRIVDMKAQSTITTHHVVLFKRRAHLQANRGLGNEGLVFRAGRDYEGSVFVRAPKPVTLVVRLEDYVKGSVGP